LKHHDSPLLVDILKSLLISHLLIPRLLEYSTTKAKSVPEIKHPMPVIGKWLLSINLLSDLSFLPIPERKRLGDRSDAISMTIASI